MDPPHKVGWKGLRLILITLYTSVCRLWAPLSNDPRLPLPKIPGCSLPLVLRSQWSLAGTDGRGGTTIPNSWLQFPQDHLLEKWLANKSKRATLIAHTLPLQSCPATHRHTASLSPSLGPSQRRVSQSTVNTTADFFLLPLVPFKLLINATI